VTNVVAAKTDQPKQASPRRAKTSSQPERVFSTSVLISGIRCTLTYVIFPFIAPIVGIASGIGSGIGLVIGLLAITSNVFSIRRFWRADHKWKWPVSVLNAGIIVLLLVLMVIDAKDLLF
jgi:hypothetical protein